jgi:hypothetical protein
MAIVDFDTATWSDPWIQGLKPSSKLLFIYLWTNNHKNLACMYSITLKTIKNEVGFTDSQIRGILTELYPKVQYDHDRHIVWVVSHVKRQFLRTNNISPKIVTGISKNLLSMPEGHVFVGEFLERYSFLNIEYPYPIDRVHMYPSSGGGGKGKGGDEGKKKGGVGENKLPDWLPQEAWDGFVEMRKKGKGVFTDRAKGLALKELKKLKEQGYEPEGVLNQSTMNSWKGIFPLKDKDRGLSYEDRKKRFTGGIDG